MGPPIQSSPVPLQANSANRGDAQLASQADALDAILNAATKKLSSIQWKQSAFDDGPDTDDSLAET